MDGQEKLLDYETIKAAVAGEKWAAGQVQRLQSGLQVGSVQSAMSVKYHVNQYTRLKLPDMGVAGESPKILHVPVSPVGADRCRAS